MLKNIQGLSPDIARAIFVKRLENHYNLYRLNDFKYLLCELSIMTVKVYLI